MEMRKFLAALQAKAAAQQAPLCDNADTVLVLLYNAYYEHVCTDDTDEIKQAFDDLYQAMTGKAHREEDQILDAVCCLCRLHQQTGFADGVQLGIRLTQELSIP